MKESTTPAGVVPAAIVEEAWQQVGASFERFCLTAGIATLAGMMEGDAARRCGVRYGRDDGKDGYRWGRTKGKLGFHGGKIELQRPRVRARDGGEVALPSWEAAMAEDWLGKWALNLMLINVSTRKFGRAMRLPEGDVPAANGAGLSKSAASRRFVALSVDRMKEWMASDLSQLDLLVIQIDGIHIAEDLVLLAAVGVNGAGDKHPLGVIEGATVNATVVQALLDNLIERGLDPKVLPPVHHRRSQGADQGDSQDLRPPYPDPALPGPQGPQHLRASAQAAACLCSQGAASGVGTGRRRSGRAADQEPRPQAGAAGSRRRRQHPGGPRRNPDRHPPRPSCRAAPLAGLHQHHREHDGHGPSRLPQ